MFVVTIARDADEAAVHAALARVGHPWRPPYDIPRLLFIDGGTVEQIEKIEGVLSCQVVNGTPPNGVLVIGSSCESFAIIDPDDGRL